MTLSTKQIATIEQDVKDELICRGFISAKLAQTLPSLPAVRNAFRVCAVDLVSYTVGVYANQIRSSINDNKNSSVKIDELSRNLATRILAASQINQMSRRLNHAKTAKKEYRLFLENYVRYLNRQQVPALATEINNFDYFGEVIRAGRLQGLNRRSSKQATKRSLRTASKKAIAPLRPDTVFTVGPLEPTTGA